MILIVAGAVVFALGTALVLASAATLASSPGASSDLGQAGRWLQFLAGLGLLGAVCLAGWDVILRSEWIAAAETAAAALGTLLLAIMLAALAASNGSSSAAAAGLFAAAIGYGVCSAAGSTGAAVAAGLLQAAGAAALAGAVAAARSRQLLTARPVLSVIAGLGLLAVYFLAGAVVAGASFHTLTALAAAYSVVTAVELAAIIALGLAAWTRVRELYR